MKTPTFVFLTLAAGMAGAQVTKKGDAYLLRVNYKPGTVIHYTMTNSTTVLKKPVIVTATIQVLSASKGTAKLRAGVSSVAGRPDQIVDYEVDDRNQASSGGGFGAVYPANPIKVGQSWTATLPVQSASGVAPGSMGAKYTFRGLKTIGGRSLAVIELTLTGGVSGSGQMLVLAADGTVFSSTTTVSVTVGSQTVKVQTSMTRK